MRLLRSSHGFLEWMTPFSSRISCLLLFCALFSGLSGQSITVSDELNIKNDDAYTILGEFESTVLLLRDYNSEIQIDAFDENLDKKWSRDLVLEKKSAEVYTVVPSDTSFHVIYGYRHKGDFLLKHRHYDPQVGLIDSSTLLSLRNLYFSPKFRNQVSEDQKKVLIFRVDKESELHAGVYDIALDSLIWKKQVTFQSGSLRRDFRDVMVTNEGDMLLLLDHERTSFRNKEFVIMRVDATTRRLTKNYIKMDNFYAFDIHMDYDNVNKRLWFAGLYNEKATGRSVGVFAFTRNDGEEKVERRYHTFNKDLLEEVHGSKANRKQGVSDFVMQDIIFRQDGGALLIAEMFKEYSRRPVSPGRSADFGSSGWRDFYFDDIIAFSINPDGEKHWNTVLHKKQYSQDDAGVYSSYFAFMTPEKLRLLFNDEIRQNSTVSEYVIRGNGYHKRSSVFSTEYEGLKLRFRDAIQVAYNECIVPSERSNRLNLVRIRFDM